VDVEKAFDSQTEPASDRPHVAALKKKSRRHRIIDTIAKLNSIAEPAFDLALIAQLQNLDDDGFATKMHDVMVALAAALRGDGPVIFANCPKCGEALEAPSPEIAVANLVTFQKARPAYYWWSPFELKWLLEYLYAHPGSVLLPPTAARSVDICEPSGRVHNYRHDGKVT
jgi:hypothetical protein